jgi:pimeloyl-ACP methyl ester carboxylesterase
VAKVLLVHGLWNRGWSMAAMAKRLRARGHSVMIFSYPTRSNGLDGHADELHRFISKAAPDELHLVGHSMGGLVILNMLSRYDDLPAGRVLLMGTPVWGSRVVKRLENLPGQKIMFGKIAQDLLRGFQQPPKNRQTGMIRGTRAMGLGRVLGKHDEPNDGSVAVSETQLEGLADSIELPVAHSEMLLSSRVVNQVEHFVLNGGFKHGS